MSLNRYAAKRDANEAEIVHALRKVGVVVYALDRPVDLLCGQCGRWVLLEIKRPRGTVSPSQETFMADCRAANLPAYVVRTAEEAIAAVRGW